jgi:hypothetical protein
VITIMGSEANLYCFWGYSIEKIYVEHKQILEAEKRPEVAVGEEFDAGTRAGMGIGSAVSREDQARSMWARTASTTACSWTVKGGRLRRRRRRSLMGPPRALEAARVRYSQASETLGHCVKKWRMVSEAAPHLVQAGEAVRPRWWRQIWMGRMLCSVAKPTSTRAGGMPGVVSQPQIRSQRRPGSLASILGGEGVDMRSAYNALAVTRSRWSVSTLGRVKILKRLEANWRARGDSLHMGTSVEVGEIVA